MKPPAMSICARAALLPAAPPAAAVDVVLAAPGRALTAAMAATAGEAAAPAMGPARLRIWVGWKVERSTALPGPAPIDRLTKAADLAAAVAGELDADAAPPAAAAAFASRGLLVVPLKAAKPPLAAPTPVSSSPSRTAVTPRPPLPALATLARAPPAPLLAAAAAAMGFTVDRIEELLLGAAPPAGEAPAPAAKKEPGDTTAAPAADGSEPTLPPSSVPGRARMEGLNSPTTRQEGEGTIVCTVGRAGAKALATPVPTPAAVAAAAPAAVVSACHSGVSPFTRAAPRLAAAALPGPRRLTPVPCT